MGELSTDGTARRVLISGDNTSRPVGLAFDDENRYYVLSFYLNSSSRPQVVFLRGS